MRNTMLSRFSVSLIVMATGYFVTAGLATAQQTTEEILVQTPSERTKLESTIGSFGATEIIELNRYVSITDLNLNNPVDVEELDTRIRAIAKDSCQKLSDMFPLERSDMIEMNLCVKRAIASTNRQKEQAITSAP